MSFWLVLFLFGTAFIGVTLGLSSPWNYDFASCSNGDATQGICTCPEGKVMARLSNRLLCFDRTESCPNGYEGLFGTCNCFAGEDSEGSCLKICSNCDNGWCSSSEKCECNEGYKMSKDNKCEPICETDCPINGFCSAPEICSCHKGYQIADEDEMLCEPICSEKCSENAYCSAPNECSCKEGYVKSGTNYCIPYCDKCFHGFCISPGNCICNIGFIKTRRGECMSIPRPSTYFTVGDHYGHGRGYNYHGHRPYFHF